MKRTRIARVSKKRLEEQKIYSEKRKAFLALHPVCQVCNSRKSREIHHMKKRGKYYLDETTWLATCNLCHQMVHDNPSWARRLGYLL
jgi:hypothetical protein